MRKKLMITLLMWIFLVGGASAELITIGAAGYPDHDLAC